MNLPLYKLQDQQHLVLVINTISLKQLEYHHHAIHTILKVNSKCLEHKEKDLGSEKADSK